MNSYQLIARLKRARGVTVLTAFDQALYHELVSQCNESGWAPEFGVSSVRLCKLLNVSEKTLRKSRAALAGAGLIVYKPNSNKLVGCLYSFSPGGGAGDSPPSPGADAGDPLPDEAPSPVVSTGARPGDTEIIHYIYNKTINKEGKKPPSGVSSSSKVKSAARPKPEEEKPLRYPYQSERFMEVWKLLRQTPRWKKKADYALQLSLDKLGRFEEDFAVEQMERAVECGWVGVVFPNTGDKYREWLNIKHGNNRKLSKQDKARSLLDEYRAIADDGACSPTDAEVLDF